MIFFARTVLYLQHGERQRIRVQTLDGDWLAQQVLSDGASCRARDTCVRGWTSAEEGHITDTK